MMKNSTATIVSIALFILGGVLTSMVVDPGSTPVGVMIFLWALFSFTPAILFSVFVNKRSQNRKNTIVNEVVTYFNQNNFKMVDQNSNFSLETSHSCIFVIPAIDSGGEKYLTIWDGVNNLRYTIPKGSVVRYRVNIDGQQVSAVGGSFLGFGIVRGGVEAVSSVNVIIIMNNGNYADICIGKNIVQNEFNDTNNFLNRLEATLEMYR